MAARNLGRVLLLSILLLGLSGIITAAQETEGDPAPTVEGLERELKAAQNRLRIQGDSLAVQGAAIEELKCQIEFLQQSIQQLAANGSPLVPSDLDHRLRELEKASARDPEMPTTGKDSEDFLGSFRVPGIKARIKLGGFVKTALVRSFNPIGSRDRFVTAAIPPDDSPPPLFDSGTSFSADQSRINLDFREPFEAGQLRAFIEGDFTGDGGGGMRLRHAYGQYRVLLAGQTWSTFVDVQATPEDVDFEGLNARIRVRQTQIRFFPRIGKNLNLAVSIEDPAPDLTGGTGENVYPDLIARGI